MENNKKFYTEDEVLDEFIGKVGTTERDEFEAKVKCRGFCAESLERTHNGAVGYAFAALNL